MGAGDVSIVSSQEERRPPRFLFSCLHLGAAGCVPGRPSHHFLRVLLFEARTGNVLINGSISPSSSKVRLTILCPKLCLLSRKEPVHLCLVVSHVQTRSVKGCHCVGCAFSESQALGGGGGEDQR